MPSRGYGHLGIYLQRLPTNREGIDELRKPYSSPILAVRLPIQRGAAPSFHIRSWRKVLFLFQLLPYIPLCICDAGAVMGRRQPQIKSMWAQG